MSKSLRYLPTGASFGANDFPKNFGAYTGGQDPRDNSLLGMRRGGKVKHPDAMQDKALIKQEMKKEAAAEPPMMAKAKGGKVKPQKKATGGILRRLAGAIVHPQQPAAAPMPQVSPQSQAANAINATSAASPFFGGLLRRVANQNYAKGGKVKAHKAKMPKTAKPVVGTLDKMPVNRAPANVMARHTPPDMTPPAGGLPYGVQPSMKRPMPTVGGDRPGMGGPITQMSRGGRTKR